MREGGAAVGAVVSLGPVLPLGGDQTDLVQVEAPEGSSAVP